MIESDAGFEKNEESDSLAIEIGAGPVSKEESDSLVIESDAGFDHSDS